MSTTPYPFIAVQLFSPQWIPFEGGRVRRRPHLCGEDADLVHVAGPGNPVDAERLDDRMARVSKMLIGMSKPRPIAAAHVAARRTDAKLAPRHVVALTRLAPGRARFRRPHEPHMTALQFRFRTGEGPQDQAELPRRAGQLQEPGTGYKEPRPLSPVIPAGPRSAVRIMSSMPRLSFNRVSRARKYASYVPTETPAELSLRRRAARNRSGAGRTRTADLEFRKGVVFRNRPYLLGFRWD